MEQADILRRARDYLDQINWGRDPLTGEKLPANTVLWDKSVHKALFFAARDLERIIIYDSGRRRPPYAPDPERRKWVGARAESVSIKKMTARVNETRDRIETKSITAGILTAYLTDRGFVRPEGKRYVPTPEGRAIGLTTYQEGEGVCFPTQAQQFLLDHLDDLADFCARAYPDPEPPSRKKLEDAGGGDARRYVQNELRILQALSQGLYPGAGGPLPVSDPACQERLKTCFDYVSRALERTLELGYYSAKPPAVPAQPERAPVPAADEPCTAKESAEDQTTERDMFWKSFCRYLYGCHRALTAYLGDPPDLDRARALGRLNYGKGQEQDYRDPLIQQFYTLRYMYAYGVEYYMMFCRLFDALKLEPSKKAVFGILSLGCGNGIDYWAAKKASADRGLASHVGYSYTGVDRVAWDNRWGVEYLSERGVRYVQGDAVGFLEEHPVLDCNTILFPRSIGEFSDGDFARLCRALSGTRFEYAWEHGVFRMREIHILVSLRKMEETISPIDQNRCQRLIEAMETNGYVLKDPAAAGVYTLDDGLPIGRYAPQGFQYPIQIADFWIKMGDTIGERLHPILTTKYFCNRVMSFVRRDRR